MNIVNKIFNNQFKLMILYNKYKKRMTQNSKILKMNFQKTLKVIKNFKKQMIF